MNKALLVLLLACFSIFKAHSQCPKNISLKLLNNSSFDNKHFELSKIFRVKNPRAFVLVGHGLNLRPSRMNPVIKVLNEAGMSVLRMSLSGHRGDFKEMKSVTSDKWIKESFLHHCLAKKISNQQDIPLYRVTYSLSSLISLASDSKYKKPFVQKQILLAPAITPRWYTYLMGPLYLLDSSLEIPSKNLENYRARDSTPIAAYQAMDKARELIKERNKSILNIPTQVFIDEDDELVSKSSLEDFVKDYDLNKWQFIDFYAPKGFKAAYHHLIIDSDQLDNQRWKILVNKLTNLPAH